MELKSERIILKTIKENGKELCTGFSREEGSYEWTGLAQVYTDRLIPGDRHVCDMLESVLPIEMEYIRTREIDTMNDYENAVKWYEKSADCGYIYAIGHLGLCYQYGKGVKADPVKAKKLLDQARESGVSWNNYTWEIKSRFKD